MQLTINQSIAVVIGVIAAGILLYYVASSLQTPQISTPPVELAPFAILFNRTLLRWMHGNS